MLGTLTALQFAFALTWVVYVIYLPALAAQAGIDKAHVPWVLAMDQAIFIVCDWAAGVHADRLARVFGRIGGWMAAVTAFSCVAFLALPWVAPAAGAVGFLVVTAVWSASSSALRAPPMSIACRLTEPSRQPFVAGFYLLGIGIATAIGPYLGLTLKGVDPRIPFALSSLVLAGFAFLVSRMEASAERPADETPAATPAGPGAVVLFAIAVLVFAAAFQFHFFVATTPAYLRFATADQLPLLTPVFWIGFNVAVLPATVLLDRFRGPILMAVGGVLGTVSLMACGAAGRLESLVIAQLVAGVSWAVVLTSAATTALALGRTGREGMVTGLMFSVLALASLARLAWQITPR